MVRPKLDDIRDWQKDLSPGQKQKLAFARLFFHRPNFVVLDECTNGISPDVEQDLYDRCTNLNLGIFSISHKIELKEFHDLELHYNGTASTPHHPSPLHAYAKSNSNSNSNSRLGAPPSPHHPPGDINGTWGLHDCKDTMGRILK